MHIEKGDNYYEQVIDQGYAEFLNQSECEDFIRWAIDEINMLRARVTELTDDNYLGE